MKTLVFLLVPTISMLLSGCSGCGRIWADFTAQAAGADWVVVQYSAQGSPINCWKLRDVSVDNEANSDGIQWRVPDIGMMHLSGWYVRIMVSGGNYEASLRYLGLDVAGCPGGRYVKVETK